VTGEGKRARAVPVALTIAGSDSGGGAGIQADLKTFSALQVFGTSAITCLTAQNPDRVAGVESVSPEMVALQIRTVCEAFPVAAVKTGMLYSGPVIEAVAKAVAECSLRRLVADPVMVATSGARLLKEDAVDALCRRLFPLATVITPNVAEAEILSGGQIRSVADLGVAARALGTRFGCGCVVKGGHLDTGPDRDRVVNVLYWQGRIHRASVPRVGGVETHGTGCTFAAATAAWLARGRSPVQAAAAAARFVAQAMRSPVRAGTRTCLGTGIAARGR